MKARVTRLCAAASLAIAIASGSALAQTWAADPVMPVPAPESAPGKISASQLPRRSEPLPPLRCGDIDDRFAPAASQQAATPWAAITRKPAPRPTAPAG